MQSRFDLPMGNVPWQGGTYAGGWRRNGQKAEGVNQGDLSAQEPNGVVAGKTPAHYRDEAGRSQSARSVLSSTLLRRVKVPLAPG